MPAGAHGLTSELLRPLLQYIFPFAAAALLVDRLDRARRAAVLTAFVGLVACALRADHGMQAQLVAMLLRAVYYVATAHVLFIAMVDRGVRPPRPLLFALCLALFVLVPALVESPSARAISPVIAWELALSAYSVCASSQLAGTAHCELLMFVFVNPVLVYAKRGGPSPTPGDLRATLGRVSLGLVALTAGVVGIGLCRLYRAGVDLQTPLHQAALAIATFLAHYAAHSGRGSLGVGLMRTFGQEIPERYHLPLMSRSPSEFWRRWNIYVGDWARCYVFLPLAKRNAARRLRARLRSTRKAVALLAAMTVVGFLHDLGDFSTTLTASSRATQAFVVFGVAALLWRLAEVAGRRLLRRLAVPPYPRATRSLSHAAFLVGMLWACATFW